MPSTPSNPPEGKPSTKPVDSSPGAKKNRPPYTLPDRYVWQGKITPAFWTIASVISLIVNLILIIVLFILAGNLFTIKSLASGLINGLHANFIAMDSAHIRAVIPVQETILVNDTMPVIFDLPLHQKTEVVLNRDTPVPGATVYLNGVPVRTDIILRQGTRLNINLDLTVPVSQTIPVSLEVPVTLNVQVDIPLSQTELHQPFVGLRDVVAPYKAILDSLPNSWYETPLCGSWTGWFCSLFLGDQ